MRNPDYLAEKFLGSEERAILEKAEPEIVRALSMGFEDAVRSLEAGGFAHPSRGVARTRFFDAMLLEALRDGARQIVNLGAGLDSRAYRFHDRLNRAKVFELDFGPMQEYKKRRVREILGSLPKDVSFVPVDFAKEDLGTVLKRAGYRRDVKTFFIWEAVAIYLPEEAVSATLRFVAQNAAPGSAIAFDYSTSTSVDARFKRYGEPHVSQFPEGRTKEFLAERGLRITLDLGADEMTARYLTRADGSVSRTSRGGFCVAVVPEKGR
jgi:methyltransferase (TIGR00027 family)